MLTYTPPDPRRPQKTHEKPWLLLLMAFAWLWPGVFSHDLWNPAEPSLFTASESMKNGGSLLVAQIFGQPDFTISPAFLWAATAFQTLFSPWAADAYDAARFAGVVFTAIGLTASGFAGFNFLGRHHGRSVVLILIGSIGLLPIAHFLNPMSAAFAAFGLILCGFSLARRRVIIAILLLCDGWVLLSLSSGYLLTAAMLFLALALSFHSTWQSKRYLLTLIGAIVVSLPLLILYPLVLSKTNPEWFAIWFNHYSLGVFGGFHQIQTAFNLPYYLKNLLWFTLPAWPLAAWTLGRTRIHDKNWGILSLSWLVIMTALLAINPQRLQDNLVWLLPPLALLGAAQLDGLRRGAAAFINWFGIMAFGLIAVFLWLGFFAMNYGWPAKLAERAAYFSPYYIPDIDPIPMTVALLFTPLWLWAITRKNIRGRQAVTNWAAGVTLAWALLMTLFLPWLNAAKSHAPVVHQMEAALSSELKQELSDGLECISIDGQDQRTRIAWTQYSHIKTTTDNPSCRYRLIRQTANIGAPSGWQTLWQGARPRNKTETFLLLEKTAAQ
ncbi:ArnT family glycosyltransferase [Neisseria sp.]